MPGKLCKSGHSEGYTSRNLTFMSLVNEIHYWVRMLTQIITTKMSFIFAGDWSSTNDEKWTFSQKPRNHLKATAITRDLSLSYPKLIEFHNYGRYAMQLPSVDSECTPWLSDFWHRLPNIKNCPYSTWNLISYLSPGLRRTIFHS